MGAPPLTVEELKQVVAQTNGGRITAQTIRKAAHTIKREGKRPRNKKQQQILALQEEKDQIRKQSELMNAQKTRQLSLVIAKLVCVADIYFSPCCACVGWSGAAAKTKIVVCRLELDAAKLPLPLFRLSLLAFRRLTHPL